MSDLAARREALDKVREKYSTGEAGSRSEVMAAADAYAEAVVEECRPYSSIKYPEAYDAIRARIAELGRGRGASVTGPTT
jgi:hypothetical protein